MEIDNKQIENLYVAIETGSLVDVMTRLLASLEGNTLYPSLAEDVISAKDNYTLMLDAFRRGMPDPGRDVFRNRIIESVCRVLQNIRLANSVRVHSALTAAVKRSENFDLFGIKERLQTILADETLSSLDGVQEKVYAAQAKNLEYYNMMFSAILVSRQWDERMERYVKEMACSPTVGTVPACLIVSAIMMACLHTFDYNKFLCLVDIYKEAQNVQIKERALVGWVFCSYTPIPHYRRLQQNVIREMCASESMLKELRELQKQVFYCIDVDKDTSVVNSELFSNFKVEKKTMNFFKQDDFDEASIEDILHPEQDEQLVEKIEQSVERFVNMQKAGSDVYFSGFSKMKSSAFFHSLFNWFLPFFKEHPSMQQLVKAMDGDTAFLCGLQDDSMFCDSDKYSFSQAILLTINTVRSASFLSLLKGGFMFGRSTEMRQMMGNETYYRRMYLQDLYRFFRLSLFSKEFANPFEDKKESPAFFMRREEFWDKEERSSQLAVCKFLLKRKDYQRLSYFLESCATNDEVNMISAICDIYYTHDYVSAEKKLEELLKHFPDNPTALKMLAKCSLANGEYLKAVKAYRSLLEKEPSPKLQLHLAYCLLEIIEVEEAVRILYELDFNKPNELQILRPLAWGLAMRGDYGKSVKQYTKIVELADKAGDKTVWEDRYNLALVSWCLGDKDGTMAVLKEYVLHKGTDGLARKIVKDFGALGQQVTYIDANLIVDAAISQ